MKDLLSNLRHLPTKARFHGKGRTQGSPLQILLLSICCLLFSLPASARIYIKIDEASEKKFPIAVADLVATSGRDRSWSEKLPETIRKDLQIAGVFDLIPQEQFPSSEEALNTAPGTIDFSPWTLIGAQALVNGSYWQTDEGTKIELHLYDPFLGQNLLTRTYTAAKKQETSVVAHHFADEIMKILTGEEGIFSTKIAYVQVTRNAKEIGVMDIDGGNAGTITRDRTINISPAWSPDGSRIAYTTFTENKNMEVAIIGSSGGTPKRLTSNGGLNLSPTWTPRGQLTIASTGKGDNTDIYLLGPDGQFAQKLAPNYGIDVNPSWSPDGSAFVFASERAGKLHLFRADAGGGNVQRLTFVGSQNDNPAWSPRGDKIAFQSLSGGWDIFIMNADGSQIQRLTSKGNCESPTWAPNGRFLAVSCGGQIHIMRDDGSNMTPVGPSGVRQSDWGPWIK